MPSKQSEKQSWSRSWNPLCKHAALPSVDGVNHITTPSTTVPDAQVTLNGLHELLKVLKESTGFFAPLRAAVSTLLSCIEIYKVCGLTKLMTRTHIPIYYQRTSDNQKEMDGLMNNIDRLSSILASRLPSCQESLTRQGINGLATYVSESCLEV